MCLCSLCFLHRDLLDTTDYINNLIRPWLHWCDMCLTTCQPLWVISSHLAEKGWREIEEIVEEIVEEMKERDRGERRKWMKVKKPEEIKTFPLYPYLLQGKQALPSCKPISVGSPGDVRYTTPLPHPTTPICDMWTTKAQIRSSSVQWL